LPPFLFPSIDVEDGVPLKKEAQEESPKTEVDKLGELEGEQMAPLVIGLAELLS
jgi:hypothetical protein